jgi:hypothetical protein
MRAHVDHRPLEARVAHHGHGDQQLAIEIAGIRRIISDARSFAAKIARCFAFRVHQQSALTLPAILILGEGSVNQACGAASQAIQWFTALLACKDMA